MNENLPDLVDFLLAQMKVKGLVPADISKRSKISPSQVSKILNRESPAGQKALQSFAEALDLPAELLFQYAGILGKSVQSDEDEKELLHLYKKMNGNNKSDLVEYARMKMKQQQEREKNGKRDRVN